MPTAIERKLPFVRRLPIGCRLPQLWDPCRPKAVTGLLGLWAIDFGFFTDVYTDTEGVVIGFESPENLPVWLQVPLRADALMTQGWKTDVAGRRWNVDVTGTFGPMEQDSGNDVVALLGKRLVLLAQDSNGRYWLVGKDFNGAKADDGTSTTGADASGVPGYSLAFRAFAHTHIPEVSAAAVAEIVLGTEPGDAQACAVYGGGDSLITVYGECNISSFLDDVIAG